MRVVRGIIFSALFAALLTVLSPVELHVGLSPVPITLENLAVMLAGAILGPLYGFFSMFLVVVLVALGLPLLHGQGGVGVLLGPTGGFVVAWPFCALLSGWLMQRVRGSLVWSFVQVFLIVFVLGDLISYIPGVLWLQHTFPPAHELSNALMLGCYPYLPGDAIKAFITTIVAIPVRNVFPVSRIIGGSAGRVVKLADAPNTES